MTTNEIHHVYPTVGDPHRTDLNGTDNLECWCHPRVEIVRDDADPETVIGLVVIHDLACDYLDVQETP